MESRRIGQPETAVRVTTARRYRSLRRRTHHSRWLTAVLLAASTSWFTRRIATLLVQGRKAAAHAGRLVRRVRPSSRRVLVIGDSSAVGVGASSPEHSVAGRLAVRYPRWSIGNLATNGCRTAQAAALLSRLRRRTHAGRGPRRPYDLLIVHAGGVDALYGTPLEQLRGDLLRLIGAAAVVADETIIVTGGNLALAPGLPAPLSWWVGRRSRQIRELFRTLVPGHHIVYVDLFRERDADPTVNDAARYFAADGLHPSDDNYRIWMHAIDRCVRSATRRMTRAPAA